MTVRLDEDDARIVATVIIGAAALGAAVVILRSPTLRRLAFGLARTALTVTIPAWVSQEVQAAWTESGRADRSAPDGTTPRQGATRPTG